ncbi:MFS transporter [Gammaproteobacteria bacterium]|nr:MFS transporter [Gammaproteobacteria bacterium]GIR94375.1 MAG: hypothetical protein CM15mP96_0330 [Gammaproteobacteria bacterium]|tara:strand:+ start:823 stop:2271 length:1449 start_codon:yes stop_codon:yes gene_type:complete
MSENKNIDVSNVTLFLHSAGSGVVGIKNVIFGTWVLLYYNQVLGLEPYLASIALGVSLFFDAISDPLVGVWSDRFKSKLGRRHPFIYASIFPLAFCIWLLFVPPSSYDQSYLFLKLLTLTVCIRLAITFFETPRAALGPELTKDYDRRNTLNAMGLFFGYGGAILVGFVMLEFFLPETSGYMGSRAYLNPEGYEKLAYFAGFLTLVLGFVAASSTHKHINDLHVVSDNLNVDIKQVFREVIETLSNKSWLMIFFGGCLYALFLGLNTGVGNYISIYFWEWTPSDISVFPLAGGVSAIIGAIIAVVISQGREKKNIALFALSATVLISYIPFVLRLIDPLFEAQTFPSNGSNALWWIMISHQCVTDVLSVMGWVILISMVFDVVEDSQKKTGRRDEGLFLAGPGLFQKVFSGLGVFILGFVLQFLGFSNTEATIQEMKEPVNNLVLFICIIGPILNIGGLTFIYFYTITRDEYESAVKDLGYE